MCQSLNVFPLNDNYILELVFGSRYVFLLVAHGIIDSSFVIGLKNLSNLLLLQILRRI